MDYEQISVGLHLIGFALGLGGATVSDLMFFRALKKREITPDTFATLEVISKVIWVGLGLLILSGLIIFGLIYSEQGSIPMLSSPRWQMKLMLVAIILINGFVFKQTIFPFLKSLIGNTLTQTNIASKIWRLAISGTVSILSWYSILLISLLPRTFRPNLLYFIGVYLVILIIGIIVSKAMMNKTLK